MERAATAEEIANWLTPYRALEIVKTAFGDDRIAKQALLERFKGGQIRTLAESTSSEGFGFGTPTPTRSLLIATDCWTPVRVDEENFVDFWTTGQISIFYREYRGRSDLRMRFFADMRRIATRRRQSLNKWFKRGTMFRAVIDVLKTAALPMTVGELSRTILAGQGVTNPDIKTLRNIEGGVRSSLNNHEGKTVENVGEGMPAKWRLIGI
jgi:hypothetical protein